jgi:hypothetical protein
MDARIPPIRVTDERIEETRNRALAKAENVSQYPLMETACCTGSCVAMRSGESTKIAGGKESLCHQRIELATKSSSKPQAFWSI